MDRDAPVDRLKSNTSTLKRKKHSKILMLRILPASPRQSLTLSPGVLNTAFEGTPSFLIVWEARMPSSSSLTYPKLNYSGSSEVDTLQQALGNLSQAIRKKTNKSNHRSPITWAEATAAEFSSFPSSTHCHGIELWDFCLTKATHGQMRLYQSLKIRQAFIIFK